MEDPEFIKGWHDLEDWIRREREYEVANGHVLPASMAITFVGDRPDVIVETPAYLTETADDIVEGLVEMFAALRPEKLAVMWPNLIQHDGVDYFGVRLNLAQPDGAGRHRWTTRLLVYILNDDRTAIVEWHTIDIARPPDPGSQRLRRIYSQALHRRLWRRGWVEMPPRADWDLAVHPDSTTLDAFERLEGVTVRDGRLIPAPAGPST